MIDDSSGVWRYWFEIAGEDYEGECEGCTTRAEAKAYEEELLHAAIRLSRARTIGEMYRERLDGLLEREGVPLAGAAERALEMTASRRRGEACRRRIIRYWGRLVSWCADNRPRLRYVQELDRGVAEAFLGDLSRDGAITDATRRNIHSCLREVFGLLNAEMCLPANPFSQIPLPVARHEGRDAFTPEELALISKTCPERLRPIFFVGLYTGMRLGDICTLRRRDVSMRAVGPSGRGAMFIRRRQRKTGSYAEAPVLAELADYLWTAVEACDARRVAEGGEDWLFPELAEAFLRNNQTVSQWFTKYLESIGLATRKRVEGARRSVNSKGAHSLRHTFCSYAGMAGIPMTVVQSMVGHMSPRMTELYSAHVSDEAKLDAAERLLGGVSDAVRRASASIPEIDVTPSVPALPPAAD